MPTGHVGFGVPRTLVVGFHGDRNFTHHGRHFGAGLPERLSCFQADLMGHFFLVGLKQFAEGLNHRLAFCETFPAPGQKRLSSFPNRCVNIFETGGIAIPDRFTCHRLHRFKGRSVALQPEPVDVHIACQVCHCLPPPGSELFGRMGDKAPSFKGQYAPDHPTPLKEPPPAL